MKFYEKLMRIQSELKAPKNQFNSFGKYNYRNCEDILESLKPLLEKYEATLVVEDEIVQIGERYYVKATAHFIEIEGIGRVSSTAYAREDETKKGMDLAQVTGSTSSYARKYALNGLFAIDDTKDSESTNTHDKGQGQAPTTTQNPTTNKAPEDVDKKAISDNSLASDAQVNYIDKLAKNKNYDASLKKYIEDAYKKKDIKSLSKQEASEVINMLNEIGK